MFCPGIQTPEKKPARLSAHIFTHKHRAEFSDPLPAPTPANWIRIGQLYAPAAPDGLHTLPGRAADETQRLLPHNKTQEAFKVATKEGDFLLTVKVILETLARLLAKFLLALETTVTGLFLCVCVGG